jgi:hypothetical protein
MEVVRLFIGFWVFWFYWVYVCCFFGGEIWEMCLRKDGRVCAKFMVKTIYDSRECVLAGFLAKLPNFSIQSLGNVS